MEKDELKELLVMDVPSHKGNFDKVYDACLIAKQHLKLKNKKLISLLAYSLIICIISITSTLLIYKKMEQANVIKRPRDVFLEEHLFFHLQWIGKSPVFDSYIAIGPEVGSDRISLDVLLKTNLLKEEDKNALIEYENSAKEKEANHEARFLICFGIIEEKDYIFLADIYYDETTVWNSYVATTFYFESNLPYSFSSLSNEFEQLAGDVLTNDCITSYNDQNVLECGIAICFEEKGDGSYQEYYKIKTYDKQEFVVYK